jgi:ABC-2 type transport system ATP-binding protein
MDILSVTDLTKTFGSKTKSVHALQGVSITVGQGEIFSLLGPNGAGKTTLIKCVLGIVFNSSGTGSIFGEPLGSVKAKARIGYLPENHRYPLHLTGGQVLNYFGKLSGVEGAMLEKRIAETLGMVGMTEWRTTKVRKYSKGMMQRLGLAQALINDPDLIMLDEPTDGVDPVGRKEIRDILGHLKSIGKTIFLNSHLLSEVEQVSDRVAIMNHGKLIREGTVDSLLAAPNRYEIQVTSTGVEQARAILGVHVISQTLNLFETSFDSVEALNVGIDQLRAEKLMIESIHSKRSSLEDLFIKLIGDAEVTKQ